MRLYGYENGGEGSLWAEKKGERLQSTMDEVDQKMHHESNDLLMPFCPVVSHAALFEDQVIWSEEPTNGTGTVEIHSSGL